MYLYHCSKCGKEVIPELLKNLVVESFGINIYNKNPRFCRCEKPDTTKSKKEWAKSMKMIGEAFSKQFGKRPC